MEYDSATMMAFEPTNMVESQKDSVDDGLLAHTLDFKSGYAKESDDTSGPSSCTTMESDATCIVGMACHLPGGITSSSDLWDLLYEKRSAQCEIPSERFNIDGFYHPDGSRAGATNVAGGYFLKEDVRQFDNDFFGISNLEAKYMDPQQRKLLEVVFECLENAGISMEDISGTNTGVFVGNFTLDHAAMQAKDLDYTHRYAATGSGTSILSNRISHVFDLRGPSFTLDTACSSTIYALHQAVTAIKNGDCDAAIVAGANLIMSPEQHVGTMKGGFLSPTSACHTFDTSADGYARSEAVSAIFVQRVSTALKKGQKIRAVIRGTAINANGKTPGITLPSAKQQAAVIRKAYQNAGLSFYDTDYIECHGTGTPVGDPIEMDGIAECFTARQGMPLIVGAVKTNLGHAEAASGITSIIKVALAFERGIIPPTYGVKTLNPKLHLESRHMKVLHNPEPWPRSLRRASVNSFGYGGANGHVILESAESYLNNPLQGDSMYAISDFRPKDGSFVFPISAASQWSLKARRSQIFDLIQKIEPKAVEGLAFAYSTQASILPFRDYVLISTTPKPAVVEVDESVQPPQRVQRLPLAFVFTGQGAQYPCMGKELFSHNSVFRTTIRMLDETLQSLPTAHAPSWTLEQTILDSSATSMISHVTRSQPICTAVQIALVDTLYSWGLQPTAVVGHSSGEIAALYSAGLLTAPQAIIAAYFRGFSVNQIKERGLMMAAGISSETAYAMIDRMSLKHVRVGCVNSPESVTLSGSKHDIQVLYDELQNQKKFVRKLETGGQAYHSHMMAQAGELYETLLSPFLSYNGSKHVSDIKMFSSVGLTSETIEPLDRLTDMAKYLRRNLELPVQFNSALSTLLKTQRFHIVEIGPHAALKSPIQQIRNDCRAEEKGDPYTSTLVRGEDANVALQKTAGRLSTHGHTLNWLSVNNLLAAAPLSVPDLPPYPWDHSKSILWSEPRASIDTRNRKHLRHELLGTRKVTENGIDWNWRNILRISEMPWLKDHKLESSIVLPAAAYVAVAIEAISQTRDLKQSLLDRESASFECKDISINAPLIVPDDDSDEAQPTELHTTMTPRKLSNSTLSTSWYDFTISSWSPNQSTLHCTGSIRVSQEAMLGSRQGAVLTTNTEAYETWAMGRWYERTREEGLNFGPHFKSLTSLQTDGSRVRTDSIATTKLDPPSTIDAGTFYPLHPITLDACFQAAIMGGTAGDLSKLRAFVPVFISHCRIQLPRITDGEDCRIHSRVTKTGFSSCRADCTLRQSDDTPVVDIQGLRLSQYTGKAQKQPVKDLFEERHPTLRVQWKPDILRLHQGVETQLRAYITEFVATKSADARDNESMVAISALLDLAGHRNPQMHVLELSSGCGCCSKKLSTYLEIETAFPRCQSWLTGSLDEHGKLLLEDDVKSIQPFDVIVIPEHSLSERIWENGIQQILSLTSKQSVIITRKSAAALSDLEAAGQVVLELQNGILLALPPHETTLLNGRKILILKPNEPSESLESFARSLIAYLQANIGKEEPIVISLSEIDSIEMSKDMICISLLEMEREFLATLTSKDMDRLRKVTDTVTTLAWVTGASMISDPNPDLALSNGLGRALMLEQPSLRFIVVDIGGFNSTDEETMRITCRNVMQALLPRHVTDDTEFIQENRILNISRFTPDLELNSLFRRRFGDKSFEPTSLAQLGLANLSISQVGMTDTMYFQQISEPSTPPPVGHVDVNLKAVSLNAKDIYAMGGRVETKNSTISLDFCGIVSAVGPDVTHLKVGDRVVALAPNCFRTTERVPIGSVHKMLPEEEFTVLPTLMTIYATAIHALRDRARLRVGESILIHAGAGAFGFAAITMAQSIGATVFTTCGSQEKRDFLTRELGVPPDHIFNSRDASFVDDIMAATGKGVDVIINSLVGDLMHESWGCLAPFGRFVEIGKKELIDAGKLDMGIFLKGATFTAFDLSEYYFADDAIHRQIFYDLSADVVELYRAGKIRPSPIVVYDIANISEAYRYFNHRDRVGKVVVSLENCQSRVPAAPAKYTTLFDSDKAYLLVGCLGGLGRSLSRWMMARGARKLVFLGRSGCDKPAAARLVSQLRTFGASVTVVQGDVSVSSDVQKAVSACLAVGPIGGVVQAAMGLQESLFTTMPNEAWHTGIQPKWKGTWNLHNALEGHEADLDFFLMTSSISGSLGTATESNYCSANGFLDAFAHYRRALGKPGTSLGLGMISEVGYLHEHPEIEAMLLRKGIQPLNEEELLQVVDMALSGAGGESDFIRGARSPSNAAHILTGLEPLGVRKLMAQGFDVGKGAMGDARTAVLTASLQAEKNAQGSGPRANAPNSTLTADWIQDIPADVVATFASQASAPTLAAAILNLIKGRFSSLILMPQSQVDEDRPLPSYGVDSMLAAEFRTWLFNAFRVDVPYLDIISPQKTLLLLSQFVEEGLKGG